MSEMKFYIQKQEGERRPVNFREVVREDDAIYSVEFHGDAVRSKLWGGVSGVEVLLLANSHRPDYNKAVVYPLPVREEKR